LTSAPLGITVTTFLDVLAPDLKFNKAVVLYVPAIFEVNDSA
jgi:hypothetical protein